MPVWFWIAVAGGGCLLILLALWGSRRFGRRRGLRSEFGSEYDYAVKKASSRKEAEDELRQRRERRDGLEIRPLDPQNRGRYLGLWARTQESFVDDPEGAVLEADRLIREVMTLRGYPPGDFEERAADLSLDHPGLASDYRKAREIARSGDSSTEDLRRAFRHYRSLFTDLAGTDEREKARTGS